MVYKEQLEAFILYEMDEQQRQIYNQNGQPIDKAAANEKTNAIVSAGSKLIKRIDALCDELFIEEYQGDTVFSSGFVNDNVGFLFMTLMTIFAQEGHFPVKVNEKEECYYNLLEIENIVKHEKDSKIREEIDWIKEQLLENEMDLVKISHYNMLRNYIWGVSMIHKEYYDKIVSKIQEHVEVMGRILDSHPELICESGNFKDHVVYILEGEDVIHIFNKNGDVMRDFHRYRTVANNDFIECSIGKTGE